MRCLDFQAVPLPLPTDPKSEPVPCLADLLTMWIQHVHRIPAVLYRLVVGLPSVSLLVNGALVTAVGLVVIVWKTLNASPIYQGLFVDEKSMLQVNAKLTSSRKTYLGPATR